MKKGIKILLIILGVIIILGIVFFAVDYHRVQKQEKPIFCIKYAIANDGGTEEYLGLGYKVIDFNRLNGYDEIKIGSWLMKYEDFKEEYDYPEELLETKVVVNGYHNIPSITVTNNDATRMKQILNEFTYDKELCKGSYSYEIIIDDEEHYRVKQGCKAIEKDNKQADLTEEELEIIEEIIENNINEQQLLEEIPQNYPMQQAIKDGCIVIEDNAVFNKSRLDSFIVNTNANNENRESDFVRIVQYTIEGAPIITDLEYKSGEGYKLTTDNTRDEYAADAKVSMNDKLPENIYTIDLVEDGDFITIELSLRDTLNTEERKEYQSITVASYSKDSTTYDTAPSFIGEVIAVNEKTLTVNSEDKNIGDAVWVSVEDSSKYHVGDKIEVFYTGMILETYPCQIYEIDVRKIEE